MKENIDFTAELIETALSGKHTEETRINNYQEYLAAKEVYKAVYSVALCFLQAAEDCINTYLKEDNVQLLFEHRTMERCYEFYMDEAMAAQRMIEEYRNYLFSGNILRAMVFNHDRRDSE